MARAAWCDTVGACMDTSYAAFVCGINLGVGLRWPCRGKQSYCSGH